MTSSPPQFLPGIHVCSWVFRGGMPRLALTVWLLAFWVGIAPALRSQWYAPPTCFHDQVQRVFPVELARVLAWRENLVANAGIAEIRYDVATAQDGGTTWVLQWLDARGVVLKETRVVYAVTLLRSGEEFYRNVTRLVLLKGWSAFRGTGGADDDAALEQAFWEGMGKLGASRMVTVRAALSLEEGVRRADDAGAAARQAGCLLACAMPGLVRQVTLDSTLAARGAAWLALCELARPRAVAGAVTKTRVDDAALNRCWATVLWLARRHDQSAELWRKYSPGPVADGDTEGAPAVIARGWWNYVLSPHDARDVCLRAAQYDAPAWGIAMLAEDARVSNNMATMAAGLRLIADIEYASAHDYMVQMPVSNRNQESMHHWLRDARREWLRTLGAMSGDAIRAIPGAADALAKAADPRVEEESWIPGNRIITGYPEAADLIRIGYREGAGKLEPAASVSARDLLNHGWEFSGLMCAALVRYHSALLPESHNVASFNEMRNTLIFRIPEMGPFFHENGWNPLLPGIDNYDRLQRVELGACAMFFAPVTVLGVPKPEQPGASYNPMRAVALMQRGWGLWEHQTWSIWGLLNSSASGEYITSMMRRIAGEGGSSSALAMLFLMDNPVNAASVARLPGADELRAWLRQRIPGHCLPWRAPAIFRQHTSVSQMQQLGQDMECAFWETGAGGDGFFIPAVNSYCASSDIDACLRLHDRMFEQVDHAYYYFKNICSLRTSLACAKGDLASTRKVYGFLASQGYDFGDMARLNYAVHQNRLEQAKKSYMSPGYAKEGPYLNVLVMMEFFDLWEKLAACSPDERTSFLVQSRAHERQGTQLLWQLALGLKLDTQDAINLFGADNASGDKRMVVAYLRKDRARFEALMNETLSQSKPALDVLIMWMRHDLCKDSLGPDTPELRPEGWQPLETQILDIILKRRAARIKEATTPATPAGKAADNKTDKAKTHGTTDK